MSLIETSTQNYSEEMKKLTGRSIIVSTSLGAICGVIAYLLTPLQGKSIIAQAIENVRADKELKVVELSSKVSENEEEGAEEEKMPYDKDLHIDVIM